jgi:hypothetical protein
MKDIKQVTDEAKRNFPKAHLFLYLIRECEFKRVAEIGVFGGNLTKRVLANVQVEKYYVVDPWKVYVESYDRPPTEKETKQEYWDGLYNRLVEMQKKFQSIDIIRMTSVAGARELKKKGEKLDCIYIDSIHDEENIVKDLYCWLPLVREGGVVSGHDYIVRFASMGNALEKIFGEELELMILNPDRKALSFKNTHQGGNWWVAVKNGNWKSDVISKIKETFPEHVSLVEEEWGEDGRDV